MVASASWLRRPWRRPHGVLVFIVLDTNVLLSEWVLNSPGGSAARHYIRQRNGILVVPEVVELELLRNLRRDIGDIVNEMRDDHGKLLRIFGSLKEMVLPTDRDIETRVGSVLDSLGVSMLRPPFDLNVARSSFLKTIDKLPPSDKTQEFKDGVVWAHCLDLLDRDDVFLVTQDKAFFRGRDYSQGLASELHSEAKGKKFSLSLRPTLKDLLTDIRSKVEIKTDDLVAEFSRVHPDAITGMLEREGFSREAPPEVEVRAFATEKASRLYLEFTMRFNCVDLRGEGRVAARLEAQGRGMLDQESGTFVDMQRGGEVLTYQDSSGQQTKRSTIVGVGSIHFGHRTVDHVVRVPVD